jgi:hypothetical protein
MRLFGVSVFEMRNRARTHDLLALNEHTAEWLVSGSLPAADAPPEYRRVAAALGALAVGVTDADVAGEHRAVTMITHTVVSPSRSRSPRRSPVLTKPRSAKVVAATLVGGLSLVTGLAMAGALPGAAQDVASTMLNKVGVSTPSPDSHAGDHPNTRGKSAEHTGPDVPTSQPSDPGKGAEISNLATTTDATGVDKGAEISSVASNGKSQAGQNTGTPPVNTPNSGGTGTADTASGGNSSPGTGIADNASGGESAIGADSAAGHKP